MALPVRVARRSAAHRTWQLMGWVALVAVVLAIPMVLGETNVRLFTRAAAISIAILGLNLVSGYSGQISLGHGAFMGFGAYTTAVLVADHHWSYFTTVPLAAVICFVIGVVVGIPALRLKGLYLALATLGLAVIFPKLVDKYDSVTGGSNGKNIPVRQIRLKAPAVLGLDPRDDGYIWVYFIVVVVAAVIYLLTRNMLASRGGRALVALRDNPIGAEASGINLARYKVLAFGISAAYAGVAGSLIMFTVSNATGSGYSLNLSIELLTGVVIGGLASLPGSLIGGLLVVFLPDVAKDWGDGTLAGAVYGVALIAIIAIYPGGVAGLLRRLRNRILVFESDAADPSMSATNGPDARADVPE